jgi:hypothetical protein
MPCPQDLLILFKFGKRDHLQQLRNHGLLHMNSQRYFQGIDDPVRGDRFETTDRVPFLIGCAQRLLGQGSVTNLGGSNITIQRITRERLDRFGSRIHFRTKRNFDLSFDLAIVRQSTSKSAVSRTSQVRFFLSRILIDL